MRNKKVVKKNKSTIIKKKYIPYVPVEKKYNFHKGYNKKSIKPIVNDRFFKWLYVAFNTGLYAVIIYCLNIPTPKLFVLNSFLIAIASYKIASQNIFIKKS